MKFLVKVKYKILLFYCRSFSQILAALLSILRSPIVYANILSFNSFKHHWTLNSLFALLTRRWSIDHLLAFKEEFISIVLVAVLVVTMRRSGTASKTLTSNKVMTRLLVHLLKHLLLMKLMSSMMVRMATLTSS